MALDQGVSQRHLPLAGADDIDGDGNITATSAVRTFTHGPPPAEPPPTTYYHPLTPARILDSRAGSGVGDWDTKWGPNTTREVAVAGFSGVPADADAVALNVTVTGTTASSLLTIWPKGQPMPNASSLNWTAGRTIANAVTVKVGTDEKVLVRNAVGSTHVIFDVVGYYDDDSAAGGGLTPLTPKRIIDSRPSTQVGPYSTKWGPGMARDVTVTGGATTVPNGADSVVLNVTVTGGTTGSFLTIWPDGEAQPTASSINFNAGQTIPNAVTTKVGAGGDIRIFNGAGSVNVIVDVVGYFDQGSGAPFRPLPAPVRIQDSRSSSQVGAYNTPWPADFARNVQVTGPLADVPGTAVAALLNVTAVARLDRWLPHGVPHGSGPAGRVQLELGRRTDDPERRDGQDRYGRPDPGLQRRRHGPRAHGRLGVLRLVATPC